MCLRDSHEGSSDEADNAPDKVALSTEFGHDLADQGCHDDTGREVLHAADDPGPRRAERGHDRPHRGSQDGEGDQKGRLGNEAHRPAPRLSWRVQNLSLIHI